MDLVDITSDILSNTISIDTTVFNEPNIDFLLERDIMNHIMGNDAPESEDYYNPSISLYDSFEIISAMNRMGIKFSEDEDDDDEAKPKLSLPIELLTEIAGNSKVQAILRRMKPEQITPSIVAELLRMK